MSLTGSVYFPCFLTDWLPGPGAPAWHSRFPSGAALAPREAWSSFCFPGLPGGACERGCRHLFVSVTLSLSTSASLQIAAVDILFFRTAFSRG